MRGNRRTQAPSVRGNARAADPLVVRGLSRDQAVDELPYGLPVATASSVERGGLFVVLGEDRQQRGPSKQPAQLGEVLFVAGAGENLHADRVADGEVLSEEAIDGVAHLGPGVA